MDVLKLRLSVSVDPRTSFGGETVGVPNETCLVGLDGFIRVLGIDSPIKYPGKKGEDTPVLGGLPVGDPSSIGSISVSQQCASFDSG